MRPFKPKDRVYPIHHPTPTRRTPFHDRKDAGTVVEVDTKKEIVVVVWDQHESGQDYEDVDEHNLNTGVCIPHEWTIRHL